MAFQDRIEILIDSIFDETGFQDFMDSVKELKDRVQKLSSVTRRAKGLAKLADDAEQLSEKLQALGMDFREVANAKEALDKISEFGGREGPTREAAQAARTGGIVTRDEQFVPEQNAISQLAEFERQSTSVQETMKQFPDAPLGGASGTVQNFPNQELAQLQQQFGGVHDALRAEFVPGMKDGNTTLNNQNDATMEAQDSTRGFRFELLGLMFAGMALQRVMFGLLRPAFEAAGVFDLISSILQFMFLPVALDVLDVILDNQGAIFDLGEDTRRIVGYIIAAAGALGFLAFVGGQVGLALDSLIIFLGRGSKLVQLFGSAAGFLSTKLTALTGAGAGQGLISTLGTLIGGLSAPVLAVAAIIVGAAALIVTNFRGIRDALTEFLASLSPFVEIAGKLLETFANFWLDSIGRGLEAIGMLAQGFFTVWSAIIAPIIQALGSSVIIVMNIFRKGFTEMAGLVKDFANAFSDFLSPVLSTALEEVSGFVEGAKDVLSLLPGVSFGGGGEADVEDFDVDTGGAVSSFFTGVAGDLGLGADTQRQIRAFNNLVDTAGDVGTGLGTELAGLGRQVRRTDINFTQNIDARTDSASESPQSRARRTGREAERGARNAFNRTAGGR